MARIQAAGSSGFVKRLQQRLADPAPLARSESNITVIATQTGETKMADMMSMMTPAATAPAPKKAAKKK